jgi:hypothetical protein
MGEFIDKDHEIRVLRSRVKVKEAAISKLHMENKKLTSMCRAAAAEIDRCWDAHCDDSGYGPSNLVGRLSGKLKPDMYSGYFD